MRPSVRIVGAAVALGAAAAAFPLLSTTPTAGAADFTGGDLVVYRVGAAGGTLTNAAAPVFLDEYDPSGTKKQSLALPTTAANGNLPLTAAGLSRSEGLISRSPDGRFVTVTGYAAAPGTTGPSGASLTASSPATVSRVVGIVDGHGGVDTSTSVTGGNAPSIIRSAATQNGDDLFVAGGNGGVLSTTLGGTSTSSAGGTPSSNFNQLSYQSGSLFTSGILNDHLSLVGSGGTLTPVPGLPDNLLTYGYAVLDLSAGLGWNGTTADTIYLANASERAGVVDKYRFNGTNWVRAGAFDVPGVSGLVADVEGGAVSLALTTPTKLLTLNDPSGTASAFDPTGPTVLASAPAGTEFRGVALAPTATPGPSLFLRTPSRGSNVAISSPTFPVTAYVSGGTVSGVTVTVGGNTAPATKGSGNVWTANVSTTGLTAGAATLSISATNGDGTTTVTRPVNLSGTSAGALTTGTYAPTSTGITRKGTWKSYNTSLSPTGKGQKSSVKDNTIKAKVYGNKLVLVFTGGPAAGKVKITVDGKATTVDLYAASVKKKTKAFTFTGALATHNVVITVAGSKNANSSGKTVSVAALQVL
ncbi:hypothetical protein F0U44_01425 [Nocardioides humilatus]|uniref:Bacterial Ig-like domain-containing protein n=1 Tax=Nocardioides humilatus TaxID=2607660 RepID=A0A5B1LJY0_9ACTN|nr:hypothetical protein [Nocardioides humilatus]KAA1421021.1 hypothetical protein F0U44_01425 [Nocardioides humilatus]